MARDPRTPDCEIAGCTRAQYRGFLCRKHGALVPNAMRMEGMIAVFNASHNAARKHWRKQLAYARTQLREGATV